jgi:hypothetical protein
MVLRFNPLKLKIMDESGVLVAVPRHRCTSEDLRYERTELPDAIMCSGVVSCHSN